MSMKPETNTGVEHGKLLKQDELQAEDFDAILDIVGSQGRFQKFLLYGIVCPIIALQPFMTLNAVFMLYEPDHWCKVPGQNGTSLEEWKNLTLPRSIGADGNERFSQCEYYDENKTLAKCFAWEYENKYFESTIPTDYNWVCDQSHYATDAFTIYYAGNVIGTIVLGQAADIIGRKPVCFLAILINLVFRCVSLFVAKYFWAFMVVQFIIGTSFPAMFIQPSMIVAEVSDKEYRAWVYAVTWLIWVVGMSALPLVAYVTDWFLLGLLTSAPLFLLLLYWKITPESPRWLLSRGLTKRAAEVVLKIAKTNGKEQEVSAGQLESALERLAVKQKKEQSGRSTGVWTLFSRFGLAMNTIMLTISWSMNVLIYYAITVNTPQMGGNPFLNFFILSVIEIPASYLGGYLVDRYGRRWVPVLFFLLCALACVGAGVGVMYEHLTFVFVINIILITVAKLCITLTFLIVYLQGTELFPTQLRSTGSGFAATVAAAVAIAGPSIVSLGKLHVGAPYMTLGGLSIIGMAASAFLPETLNQKLPETLEDASNFGKDDKFWSFLPKKKEMDKDEFFDTHL